MDQILDSPTTTERNFEYAGFWIRVAAYFIDGILLTIVQVAIGFIFFGGYSFTEPNYVLTGISTLLGIAYFSGMESSSRQATIGKMAVGVKVGNLRGEPISFGNAVGRYFAKILSTIILCIGFMMAGWDSKKQALHDRLADTYVYYA